MKTRRILIAIATLLFMGASPAFAAKKSITGTVTCEGKGVAGVVVTDGINLTKTDAKGVYTLPTKVKDPHCQFVHISIPSGYEVERIGNAPQFYKRVDPKAKKQSFDFKLTKVDQSVYTILTLADHHLTAKIPKKHADHRSIERYKEEAVPMMREYAAQCGHPVYMVALGDMTQTGTRPGWKGRAEGYSFADYMRDTDIDLPIFNAIGNHDHNHAPKGEVFDNETVYLSREDYNRELGPEYYSFNIGREHYVVVDNTFVITKDSGPTNDPNATKGYWYRLDDYQHNWLAQDIAALDKSKVDRIVLLAHCGLFGYSGKKQQMDLEQTLEHFNGYEVVALIGHHHADHSLKKMWNEKPLYQFIHPSAAGTAWYSFDNCEGTPAAIVDYTFKEGKFTRTYVPYGPNKGLKYRVYDNRNNKWNYPITERTGTKQKRETEAAEITPDDKPAILVNIWGAYTCKFTESTGGKGKVVKRCFDLNYRDWYWATYAKSEAGELPIGQRLHNANWQRPKRGYHIWRYTPANPDATIKVVAKDVLGNVVAEFEAHAK